MALAGAGFDAGRPDDAVPADGPGRSARLRGELRRHPSLLVGGVLAAATVIVAIAGHVAPPDNPLAINPGHALAPPGPGHWFGTDQFGRDVFSRVLYGLGIDVVIGLTVAALAFAAGSAAGLVSGYLGGWMPTPRKLRPETSRMAQPTIRVAWTKDGPTAFGKTCSVITRDLEAPTARAPST